MTTQKPSSDYAWQSAGHPYCNPVQFASNQLATQIVNASNQLATKVKDMHKLSIAQYYAYSELRKPEVVELNQEITRIMEDIRSLALGKVLMREPTESLANKAVAIKSYED